MLVHHRLFSFALLFVDLSIRVVKCPASESFPVGANGVVIFWNVYCQLAAACTCPGCCGLGFAQLFCYSGFYTRWCVHGNHGRLQLGTWHCADFSCVCLLCFRGKDFLLWAIILHRGVCGDTLQPITFVFRRSLRHVFAHAEWLTPDVNLVRGGCFCIGNLHVPRGHAGRCLACRCSSCLPMVGS